MYLFFGICAIFFSQCIFPNVNALLGANVRQARPGEFPFIVTLMNFDPENDNPVHDLICTAALITTAHVLSAAQCIEDNLINETIVLTGTNSLVCGRIHGILWWISYDSWSEYRQLLAVYYENDISVTKLVHEVDTDIVPGIISYMPSRNITNIQAELVGWRQENRNAISPYMVTSGVNFMTNGQCRFRISYLSKVPVFIHERYLCTYANPYVLLYRGDFGGPLIYQNRIIGINKVVLPVMNGYFHPGKINIHTSIEPYREFIEDVTRTMFYWN